METEYLVFEYFKLRNSLFQCLTAGLAGWVC